VILETASDEFAVTVAPDCPAAQDVIPTSNQPFDNQPIAVSSLGLEATNHCGRGNEFGNFL
jgi:hypothetical protein